ncbi:MAG: transketolase [Candidatus Micrarchaeota archaeon]
MGLHRKAVEIRKKIVHMISRSKSSHIGSALSSVDILVALYFSALRVDPKDHRHAERDRFLMSKGHACAALYATLSERGFFEENKLEGFYVDGGDLPGHSTFLCAPGVEASTGSLGHGLSIGVGMALAGKMDKKKYRTFVLLGDGECNEGSVWEAAMFAGNAKLEGLVAIIDYNKIQSFGFTKEVNNLEPLRGKWESFGWAVKEVDGHDLDALCKAFESIPFDKGKPSVVIAHTVKGKGVSFMENKLEWHYKSPDEGQRKKACEELECELRL